MPNSGLCRGSCAFVLLIRPLKTRLSGSSSSVSSSTSSGAPASKPSLGMIVGIVVAVVAAVLAAGAAFFFYRRWKTAMATQSDLYRVCAPQRHPETAMATTATIAFSSSLETRNNTSLLHHDTSSQALSGRPYQQLDYNYQGVQYHGRNPIASHSDDSRSVTENAGMVSSPTRSSIEEGLSRRPLPGAPGGGLPLSAESPKLAGLRGVSLQTRTSVSISELPPPNYDQATGTATVTE
ncbi:hypothetical protein BS17DRAFT_466641 [Gyrodon lividus]|nr:hypothetical protein BS17DRAFT_466641 [Gyrodon lividus]